MQREVKKAEKVNLFTIYLPKKATIKRADTLTVNAELISNFQKTQRHSLLQNLKDKESRELLDQKKKGSLDNTTK